MVTYKINQALSPGIFIGINGINSAFCKLPDHESDVILLIVQKCRMVISDKDNITVSEAVEIHVIIIYMNHNKSCTGALMIFLINFIGDLCYNSSIFILGIEFVRIILSQ